MIVAVVRKNITTIPLVAVAAMFFLQFVLIGAGKPAEYGRFGLFTNSTLAILTASVAASSRSRAVFRIAGLALSVGWVGLSGATYAQNFRVDATDQSSRTRFADYLMSYTYSLKHWRTDMTIVVPSDPAPYNLPPLPFHDRKVLLVRSHLNAVHGVRDAFWWFIHPVDSTTQLEQHSPEIVMEQFAFTASGWWETPISWANKPFVIENTVGVAEPNLPLSSAPQR
jgi:hypothetical protein